MVCKFLLIISSATFMPSTAAEVMPFKIARAFAAGEKPSQRAFEKRSSLSILPAMKSCSQHRINMASYFSPKPMNTVVEMY